MSALEEKRRQIRMLEEENANLLRDIEAKKQRIERLKNDPRYRSLKHLGRLQARLDEEHFSKISRFLEQDRWEATNNGAERMGRAFRHLQKPRVGSTDERNSLGQCSSWSAVA